MTHCTTITCCAQQLFNVAQFSSSVGCVCVYADQYPSQQQRHSLAEQSYTSGAHRMYDIPLDGAADHKAPPPPSHRQRTPPSRPRLPSPDPSGAPDTSACYDRSADTPPPIPKRYSNERLPAADTPRSLDAELAVSYDRGRERRPLGNIDPATFDEQLRGDHGDGSRSAAPVPSPQNHHGYG